MDEEAKEVSYESKEKASIPKGAKILKKEVRIAIREIENGFILRKSFDIKYSVDDKTDYTYFSKETYYKENPVQIDDKMLADYFD